MIVAKEWRVMLSGSPLLAKKATVVEGSGEMNVINVFIKEIKISQILALFMKVYVCEKNDIDRFAKVYDREKFYFGKFAKIYDREMQNFLSAKVSDPKVFLWVEIFMGIYFLLMVMFDIKISYEFTVKSTLCG